MARGGRRGIDMTSVSRGLHISNDFAQAEQHLRQLTDSWNNGRWKHVAGNTVED